MPIDEKLLENIPYAQAKLILDKYAALPVDQQEAFATKTAEIVSKYPKKLAAWEVNYNPVQDYSKWKKLDPIDSDAAEFNDYAAQNKIAEMDPTKTIRASNGKNYSIVVNPVNGKASFISKDGTNRTRTFSTLAEAEAEINAKNKAAYRPKPKAIPEVQQPAPTVTDNQKWNVWLGLWAAALWLGWAAYYFINKWRKNKKAMQAAGNIPTTPSTPSVSVSKAEQEALNAATDSSYNKNFIAQGWEVPLNKNVTQATADATAAKRVSGYTEWLNNFKKSKALEKTGEAFNKARGIFKRVM